MRGRGSRIWGGRVRFAVGEETYGGGKLEWEGMLGGRGRGCGRHGDGEERVIGVNEQEEEERRL
eukprot:754452-Hanusia_phi.AAC.12